MAYVDTKIVKIPQGNDNFVFVIKVKLQPNKDDYQYLCISGYSLSNYSNIQYLNASDLYPSYDDANSALNKAIKKYPQNFINTAGEIECTPSINDTLLRNVGWLPTSESSKKIDKEIDTLLLPVQYKKLYDHWFIKFLLIFIRLKK